MKIQKIQILKLITATAISSMVALNGSAGVLECFVGGGNSGVILVSTCKYDEGGCTGQEMIRTYSGCNTCITSTKTCHTYYPPPCTYVDRIHPCFDYTWPDGSKQCLADVTVILYSSGPITTPNPC